MIKSQIRFSLHAEGMIQQALAFATAAHEAVDQRRRYTDEPYIVHPVAVAQIVMQVPGHTWQMVCAALLHDVVEDTKVRIETITAMFGEQVGEIVAALTNVPADAGNRAERFQLNKKKLAKASPEAKTVKLADLIHNTQTIVEKDKKFAPVYLGEKLEVLEVLTEGDKTLWNHATIHCVMHLQNLGDESLADLAIEYDAWLKEHGLPEGSAEELLMYGVTPDQAKYLEKFIRRANWAQKMADTMLPVAA